MSIERIEGNMSWGFLKKKKVLKGRESVFI